MSSPSSERLVSLPDGVDLHARPAARFVRTAMTFEASIAVAAGDREANAKSILEILALGAEAGTELRITGSGADAAEAVDRLAALVAELR